MLTGIEGLGFVHLSARDVVRHRIVADIVNAYERDAADRPAPADGAVARRAFGSVTVAEGPKPRLAKRRLVGGDGEPHVFCADEQSDVAVDLARWQQLAGRCLHTLGVRGLAELSVLYVGTDEITELNERVPRRQRADRRAVVPDRRRLAPRRRRR